MRIEDINIKAEPFRYGTVENAFSDQDYRELCQGFKMHRQVHGERLGKLPEYGAEILPISSSDAQFFMPLFEPKLLQGVADRFNKNITAELDAATHYHPPGGSSGWIHNDFNPGWFENRNSKISDFAFSADDACDYTGRSGNGITECVQRVRCLTLIYYLNNDHWSETSGGFTGLYESRQQNVEAPTVRIAPMNNSLLVFECSPHSLHSFTANRAERSSIIIWLHRDKSDAKQQWPLDKLSSWG